MLVLFGQAVNGFEFSSTHLVVMLTRVRRGPDPAAVQAVAALRDPVRRSLFDAVTAGAPMTREEASDRAGISRRLAAFHLDKLVAAGLLAVETAPTAGRVGRRPRVYRRADGDVHVSIPARRPQLLARLLVHALSDQRRGEDGAAAARRVSHASGREVGASERGRLRPGRLGAERALTLLRTLLEGLGYEPTAAEAGRLGFVACPFHPLSADSPELVCGMHHAYVTGLLEGLEGVEATTLEASLEPGTDGCCVEVRASP
jgi:predicted ArsR family transcriptional regulator